MDIQELHEKILYPTVLVRTDKAGGSGTVVASIEHDGEWRSYILTNHHVIADALGYPERWDPVLKRDMKVEVRDPVLVGFYTYRRASRLDSTDQKKADIVAYDEPADVALLEMVTGTPPRHIAEMLPKGSDRKLQMGMPLMACGCSLGHKPLFSPAGMISSLDERIDNLAYWMSNTSIIFGNSGGGMYLTDTGQFIGIPSRLDVAVAGLSAQAMPFLNYFIPIPRIYGLFEDWSYQFLYDPEFTYEECAKMRKEKQDELTQRWEQHFRSEREVVRGPGSGDASGAE